MLLHIGEARTRNLEYRLKYRTIDTSTARERDVDAASGKRVVTVIDADACGLRDG